MSHHAVPLFLFDPVLTTFFGLFDMTRYRLFDMTYVEFWPFIFIPVRSSKEDLLVLRQWCYLMHVGHPQHICTILSGLRRTIWPMPDKNQMYYFDLSISSRDASSREYVLHSLFCTVIFKISEGESLTCISNYPRRVFENRLLKIQLLQGILSRCVLYGI